MNTLKYFWRVIKNQERRQLGYWLVLTIALGATYIAISSTYPLESQVLRYLVGAYVIDSIFLFAVFRHDSKLASAMLVFLTIFEISCIIYYYLLGYSVILCLRLGRFVYGKFCRA